MPIFGLTVWELFKVLLLICAIIILVKLFIKLLGYRKTCNMMIKRLREPKITKNDKKEKLD